ncbi:MAG: cation transporter [Alphaproteobacteria bacterium]|nr:cation transporter [Alphaproteobacteria bacterium]
MGSGVRRTGPYGPQPDGDAVRYRSTFAVPGMDCPSEERLIRMALDKVSGVESLHFDLEVRRLEVVHLGVPGRILEGLEPLGLGARLEDSVETTSPPQQVSGDPVAERRVLRQLLGINAAMFVVELGLGLYAQSTGLVADSLDMFADAVVYGVSLFAVGRAASAQQRAAHLSGWLQLLLALGALGEVVRRAVGGSEPVETLMIGVAGLALVANTACIALLARHRSGGLHLRASWIFSTNDALANLGVMLAGVLVAVTGSAIPDLIVGSLVALVVLSGAVRILRLRG